MLLATQQDALPVMIRTWQDEAAILDAVHGVLPSPKCVEGVPPSSVCGDGKPVDTLLVKALADLPARATGVRKQALPPLPACWPRDDQDSQGFLRTLAHLADQQIRQPSWDAFGGLFAAPGIPEDALIRFAERVPAMARRPYSLLHADLHRENLIMAYAGDPPLICVDLELATYGDPLHDLATHLVRMRYPSHQWEEVIDAWAQSMGRVRPSAVHDVMRAAQSLRDSPDQKSLDEATARVHETLSAAARPLELRNLPGEQEIEGILVRRRDARTSGSPLRPKSLAWMPDIRVPERPDFPHSAVRKALRAEGAAPASRVFKGTGHLNSVVEVDGVDFPVVVRRKVANICRRERGYLNEHAVLGVIEESRCGVSAPRSLALGKSYQGEPFAIHTYAGPPLGTGLPPDHPVDGLWPHEADCLVDQLRALTKVDCTRFDRTAGQVFFYTWLSEQLVDLVNELPRESQQLARLLGLPDGPQLGEILARHHVRERKPALLHGDLNPWNLVRRADGPPLTIIDWEMAVVGDPLYDLVRHIHLSPTRPEIRERMQRRWVRLLEPEHTAHWRADWSAYRRIEIMRSAYIDLDRLVTGASLDAPNVRRAVDAYAGTLAAATRFLGLRARLTANPFLVRALAPPA